MSEHLGEINRRSSWLSVVSKETEIFRHCGLCNGTLYRDTYAIEVTGGGEDSDWYHLACVVKAALGKETENERR